MKKFFSLVLALVMALSLTTVAWGATTLTFAQFEAEIIAGNGTFDGGNTTTVVLKDSEREYQNNKTCQFLMGNAVWADDYTTFDEVNVSNVAFVFEDDDTANAYINGELQVFTSKVAFTNCTFDGVAVSPWGNNTNGQACAEATFTGCVFENLSGRSAVHQNKAAALTVDGCTFDNCSGGIHTVAPAPTSITITDNTFTNTPAGGNAITLGSEGGDMSAATVAITDNDTDGIFLRQLNSTVTPAQETAILDTTKNTYATATTFVAEVGGTRYESLQAAVDAAVDGDTVVMLAACDKNIIITQKENVDVILDGNGNTFTGSIEIYGQARHTGAETLKIQNINFTTDKQALDFIHCNTTEPAKRYAHNVTIEDCSFTATAANNEVVATRFRQCYNIQMIDCDVTGLHSAMWATGTNTIVVDNLTANCLEGGLSVGTSASVTVKNSSIEATGDYGYGLRADGSAAYTYVVENCDITADVPVLVRKASGYFELDVNAGTTLNSTGAEGYQVAFAANDYEANTPLTAATGTYTFNNNTGAELSVYQNGFVVDGVSYTTLAAAVAAADNGDTIVFNADSDENVTVGKALTFDFNGYTYSGVITPASGYTYMDGVVKKTPAASGTTSTGTVTSGTVTPVKAKLYRLAAVGGSMIDTNTKVEKIELTTVTGKLVNDVPVYVPDIYKINSTYYVEVAKAHATYALKNNGVYTYLAPAGTASNVDAVIAKFATAVVLDQYVAAAEDVECGDAVKGTKGAAIYKSGTDAYYADGSNWAVFKGEFVTYDKNTKVAYKEHKWDAKSIIVKATDVKGTKVPVTIECEDCEKTFSIVPSAKFDNTWVKGVNYTTDNAVDKYNTAAVKYYIVLNNATSAPVVTPSTDKVVQSADTFDAGIAMYVGMSVMAAAGSAVVLKKRED